MEFTYTHQVTQIKDNCCICKFTDCNLWFAVVAGMVQFTIMMFADKTIV